MIESEHSNIRAVESRARLRRGDGSTLRILSLALLLLIPSVLFAQQREGAVPDSMLRRASPNSEGVVRVINDPGGHAVWLLKRDPAQAGGPGRLERVSLALGATQKSDPHALVDSSQDSPRDPRSVSSAAVALPRERPAGWLAALTPIIRAGDRVLVEQHTAAVDAHFIATALGPACVGQLFEARLVVGGKRLRVKALSPGRARVEGLQNLDTSSFGEAQ